MELIVCAIIIALLVVMIITMAGMLNEERKEKEKLKYELTEARAEKTKEFYRSLNVCKRTTENKN